MADGSPLPEKKAPGNYGPTESEPGREDGTMTTEVHQPAADPARRAGGGLIHLHHLFDDLSWIWLVGVTVLVVLTYREYGIVWDAEVQNEYGKKLLAYYMSGFADRSAFEYQNLYLYGGAFDLLAAAANLVSPLGEYETRSLLGGLVGVLGLVGTWRFARMLAGERAGFLAVVLLTLIPDYYGHMLINPKDVPFACGMTWTLYLACRTVSELPRPRLRSVLALGLAGGLTLGSRVGGLLDGAYLVAILGLYLVLVRRNGASVAQVRSLIGRLLLRYLPGLALAYAVMALCWPWAVQSPLNPLVALGVFSHFTWPNQVLAAGVLFKASNPPAWYLPLMLAVKLPEVVLVGLALAAWSGVSWLVNWLCDREHKFALDRDGLRRLQFVMLLLGALFPIGYYLVERPEVYNGIRHFLFVVPPLAVIAGVAFDRLWQVIDRAPRLVHRGALALFSAALVAQAWIMMELHPNQYIYYNQLVGGVKGADGRYELDYWGTSIAQAAEELATYVLDENGGKPIDHTYKVLVCAHPESAMYFLPKQFELTRSVPEGDFFIGLTLSGCNNSVDGQQIIRVERFGAILSVVKDRRDLKPPQVNIAVGAPAPGPPVTPPVPSVPVPKPPEMRLGEPLNRLDTSVWRGGAGAPPDPRRRPARRGRRGTGRRRRLSAFRRSGYRPRHTPRAGRTRSRWRARRPRRSSARRRSPKRGWRRGRGRRTKPRRSGPRGRPPGIRSRRRRPSASPHAAAKSSPTSKLRTVWVSQPREIMSTPVSATARTVSGVMPPEASVIRRRSTMATARRRVSGSMLSSSTASTLSVSSSASCSRVSTSISILTMWPMAARARSTAGLRPPATTRWLSLISTASSSPKRWLEPPPTRIAYFSRARRPGVVLRVQTISVGRSAMWPTRDAVAVAMPESRPRMLRAVRSPLRIGRARPSTTASTVPASTSAPSPRSTPIHSSGSSMRNADSAMSRPATRPGPRATSLAWASASGGTTESVVRSPARPRSSSRARRISGS